MSPISWSPSFATLDKVTLRLARICEEPQQSSNEQQLSPVPNSDFSQLPPSSASVIRPILAFSPAPETSQPPTASQEPDQTPVVPQIVFSDVTPEETRQVNQIFLEKTGKGFSKHGLCEKLTMIYKRIIASSVPQDRKAWHKTWQVRRFLSCKEIRNEIAKVNPRLTLTDKQIAPFMKVRSILSLQSLQMKKPILPNLHSDGSQPLNRRKRRNIEFFDPPLSLGELQEAKNIFYPHSNQGAASLYHLCWNLNEVYAFAKGNIDHWVNPGAAVKDGLKRIRLGLMDETVQAEIADRIPRLRLTKREIKRISFAKLLYPL